MASADCAAKVLMMSMVFLANSPGVRRRTTSIDCRLSVDPSSAHLGHTRRRSGESATSEALFFLHARSDGLDDRRRHLEGIPPIYDVVPVRNPIKIGIDRPDINIRILMDQ